MHAYKLVIHCLACALQLKRALPWPLCSTGCLCIGSLCMHFIKDTPHLSVPPCTIIGSRAFNSYVTSKPRGKNCFTLTTADNGPTDPGICVMGAMYVHRWDMAVQLQNYVLRSCENVPLWVGEGIFSCLSNITGSQEWYFRSYCVNLMNVLLCRAEPCL